MSMGIAGISKLPGTLIMLLHYSSSVRSIDIHTYMPFVCSYSVDSTMHMM